MNSVIKRKFGDSLRERKHRSMRRIALLMAIVYNIHVIVREGKVVHCLLIYSIELITIFATKHYSIGIIHSTHYC